jgi:amino acid transporter
MTAVARDAERTTAAALEEKTKLQKHFGRFDMFFFLVCTLVGLDTIGTVASNGAQGFTWLIFLVPVFFIPYALLTSELGSTFTEEGGPYIWTKLSLGRFIGGVNALIYWIANPIWLGGTLTITAVATFDSFFFHLGVGKYIFGLLFIWISVWAAILSFGVGKWLPTIGAWGRMLVLGFFSFTFIIYAIKLGVLGVGG